jgi:hypothetical protein
LTAGAVPPLVLPQKNHFFKNALAISGEWFIIVERRLTINPGFRWNAGNQKIAVLAD